MSTVSKNKVKVIDLAADDSGFWGATKAIINYEEKRLSVESKMVVGGDSKKIGAPIIVGGDSLRDPYYEYNESLAKDKSGFTASTAIPIEMQMTIHRRWSAAVRSPKGHFITYVASVDAFRDGWNFVKTKNRKEDVDEDLKYKLEDMTRDYDIKHYHQLAVALARSLGKSLIVKLNANPTKSRRRRKKPIKLRVLPIEEGFIKYDSYGEPEIYSPMAYIGREIKQLIIPWDHAVLYVHKEDPFGNGTHGIPETFPAYNQLKWMANIQEGWATSMNQRGISMIHFAIPGFEFEDLSKWQTAYGSPAAYSVVFTDNDVKVQQFPSVSAAFDLDKTNDAWTKEVASSSGMAQSRIDGSQRGQVTGTQTDTDNYYGILCSIQEENNANLLELYEMLDPDLDQNWDVDYQIAQKTDQGTKVQIEAQLMSIIQMGADYLTYNDALRKIGKDPIGKEGDIPASKYIAENIAVYEDTENGGGNGDNGGDGGAKEAKARQLLAEGKSIRMVNQMIREEFGSGMSHSKLVKLRAGEGKGTTVEPVAQKERKVEKTNTAKKREK